MALLAVPAIGSSSSPPARLTARCRGGKSIRRTKTSPRTIAPNIPSHLPATTILNHFAGHGPLRPVRKPGVSAAQGGTPGAGDLTATADLISPVEPLGSSVLLG